MAQTTPTTEAAKPPTKAEAYARLSKAILRRRALDQLLNAIKRDLTTLPKGSVMATRSIKVLDYMRGYDEAVQFELDLAGTVYDEAAYQEKRAARLKERKSTLARHRNGTN